MPADQKHAVNSLWAFAQHPHDYVAYLDLPVDPQERLSVLGARVLDIGAGRGHFAADTVRLAAEVGGEIQVAQLNPQLLVPSFRKILGRSATQAAVIGLVQNLPYADESFDSVVSLAAFPTIFNESTYATFDDYKKAYDEVVRVLRPGGNAYLGYVGNYALNLNRRALSQTEHAETLAIDVADTSHLMDNTCRLKLTKR